jgi:hypothetical protein
MSSEANFHSKELNMSKFAELQLQIDAPGRDKNELEDLSRLLRQEIAQLDDVESVEPVSGEPVSRSGAMAVDWYEIGVLSIKMATAVLPPLLLTIKAWLERQSSGKAGAAKDKFEKQDLTVKFRLWGLSFEMNRSTSVAELTKEVQNQIENRTK